MVKYTGMNFRQTKQQIYAWVLKNLKTKHLRLMLSIIVGAGAGLTAVIMKNTVHYMQNFLTNDFAKEYHNYYFFIYPFIGLFLTYIFLSFIQKKEIYRGIPGVIWAIKKKNGLIHLYNTFSVIIASILTVGFGGSVGLEGPTVSASSSIGSFLGRKLHLDHKTIILLIGCTAAGTMAGIFNAPITALVFVLEIFMFDMTITSMIPFLAASIAGALSSRLMLGNNILFNVVLTENFDISDTPYYIMLGMVTGLVSVYFNRTIWFLENQFEKISTKLSKLLIGGLGLGVLIFLIPPLYGEGFEIINALLSGDIDSIFHNSLFWDYKDNAMIIIGLLMLLIIFKAIATSLTIEAGGVSGVFAPSLFLGATTGFIFSKTINFFDITHLSEKNFTLVGMAGLIAGVLHAPLTSLFLIAEITKGYELIIPLMIIASISYLTSKYYVKDSIFAMTMTKRGEILTHHKDKNVLTMLKLKDEIEKDFLTIHPSANLGELLDQVVSKSQRNIYPVVDENGYFVGVITLNDVRTIMFKTELYNEITVESLMYKPLASVSPMDNLEHVMEKFNETKYWNLPVLEDGKYIGFISKSKLFNAYRKMLLYFSEE